jgi:hypothetical protein
MKCMGRSRAKAMKNALAHVLAGEEGERLHTLPVHSTEPSYIYLFNTSDIIYKLIYG